MDTRLDSSQRDHHGRVSACFSRKSRKHCGKKSNRPPSDWISDVGNDVPTGAGTTNLTYPRFFWQQATPRRVPGDHRLYAALSEPSMCGYSALPMPVPWNTMEPMSLPTMYGFYRPLPVPPSGTSIRNRSRQYFDGKLHVGTTKIPRNMVNGMTSHQENGSQSPTSAVYRNGEYASLPPSANNSNKMNNEIEGDEVISGHRRYSDPGLGPAVELPRHTQSGDSDSVDSGSSITTVGRGNKLVISLIEQVTELKKSNVQLFKELNTTKADIERLRGKLATYESVTGFEYQPGMLSDLIHQIREANKICEERLIAKITATLEDDQSRKSKDIDRLKIQLTKVTREKEESDRRVAKLEEEVAALKLNAKLEKLVTILREKTNNAMTHEEMEHLMISGLPNAADFETCTSTVERTTEDGNFSLEDDGNNDDDNGQTDGSHDRSHDSSCSNHPKRVLNLNYATTSNESGINLCGPVTDL